MAETSTTAKPTPAAKPAAAKPAAHGGESKGAGMTAAEAAELQAPMTRREFLNYAFLASLGIFFVGGLGWVSLKFAFPLAKAGEFGGIFHLGAAKDIVPAPSDPPIDNSAARIHVVNVEGGVLALYNVCVHLGCLYQWQTSTNRFECPCHGSKYQKNGTYIEGPAPRSLDRMVISFVNANGQVLAQTDATGDPVPIPDPNATLIVDTGKIILGKTHG